jgi:hypothetical protein
MVPIMPWMHDEDRAAEVVVVPMSAKDLAAGDARCDDCDESPCVFLKERKDILAHDKDVHAGMSTANSTRRRLAFKHMFYVLNGGPGTGGIRKRHPKCVEDGIHSLFPDSSYMGYKEK